MKIFVSGKARQDLLRTFSYLAERNPIAAEALLQAIDRKFEQLCRFPFIGRERSSLGAGLRSVFVRTHLIYG
jgi:plasmid stabilization system protein ParE